MTLDPALLPWADKIIILTALLVIFLLARGQRAVTFPVAPPGPVPAPVPVPTPEPSAPSTGPSPAPEPSKPAPPIIPPVVVPPAPAGGDFDRCLAITLKWEGGNDDDFRDPGGRTSRGITAEDWAAWRQTHPGLPADVWQAPQGQIVALYKERYWNSLYCDSLPNGVDMVVFDHGVLAGIGTSAKLLQTIVGTNVDGEIGPLTIAATAAMDPISLVGRFSDGRLAYYQSRPGWPTYGKGWTNRVVDVRKEALALAAEAPRPKPAVIAPSAVALAGTTVLQHNIWPTQAECPTFYGNDEATIRAAIVNVQVPWLMNGKTHVIPIHKRCAESLTRIVNFIWETCGKSQDQIHAFGYDIFDGSFVPRNIAGTSTRSMHWYGVAIDFDAAANPQHATNTKFKSDSLITTAFETEGWIWGGRWSVGSVDNMHFQAARVR